MKKGHPVKRIPALLIAVAVGAIVTGSAVAANTGTTIDAQPLSQRVVLPTTPEQSVHVLPTNTEITVQASVRTGVPAPTVPPVRVVAEAPTVAVESTTPAPVSTTVPPVEETTDRFSTPPPPPPVPPHTPPPIIPIVYAWDGVSCAKSESWYEPHPMGGADILLCPTSRRP